MYLKIAYMLAQGGSEVIGARVADFLGVSRPSASIALRRLASQHLLQADKRRVIQLTPQGLGTARTMVRRQRLFETWLIDTLGLRWAEAFDDACRLEHAISTEVEDRLFEALGRPTRCPHGNPIDTKAPPRGTALSVAAVGTRVSLLAIGFPLEFQPGYLAYLQDSGVIPGATLTVGDSLPDGSGLEVEVAGRSVVLPAGALAAVRIEPTTSRHAGPGS